MSLRYVEPHGTQPAAYLVDGGLVVKQHGQELVVEEGGEYVTFTQQEAAELLPLLCHFARTGCLVGAGEEVAPPRSEIEKAIAELHALQSNIESLNVKRSSRDTAADRRQNAWKTTIKDLISIPVRKALEHCLKAREEAAP